VIARRDFNLPLRWLENTSDDTQENAENAARILQPHAPQGVRRIVLVTHAYHMQRARRWFELQGFEVQPAAMGFTTDRPERLTDWLPDVESSRRAKRCFRELYSRVWQGMRLPFMRPAVQR
jgi:uncharacterized SAM-binding protein YcdF (DUF218 family)